MRLSDIQPQYFPRLHYIARVLESVIFVIRDDVQFVRNHKYPDGKRGVSYQAHTPIKCSSGVELLSVSIKKGGLLAINKTGISYDQPWMRKHINIIKNNYHGSLNSALLIPEIESLLEEQYANIAELNIATTCWILSHLLGVERVTQECLSLDFINELIKEKRISRLQRIELGSNCVDTSLESVSIASERIVELCKKFNADQYYGGGTALRAYMDTELFERNSINVTIQEWDCPIYQQQYTLQAGFIANLSTIDFLMNVPLGDALSLLKVS